MWCACLHDDVNANKSSATGTVRKTNFSTHCTLIYKVLNNLYDSVQIWEHFSNTPKKIAKLRIFFYSSSSILKRRDAKI